MATEDRLSPYLSHDQDLQVALIASGNHEVQMLNSLIIAALRRLKTNQRANLALRMSINADLKTFGVAYSKQLCPKDVLLKRLITAYKEFLNEKED